MGLLDEAIREHLELKRRRGADPAEISIQEQEALGPARSVPEPLEVVQPDDDYDQLEPTIEPAEQPEHEIVDVPQPDPHAAAREIHHGDPLAHEHAPAAEHVEAPTPSTPSTEPVSQETAAFDVEGSLTDEQGEEEEEEG